jgi:hypothetical protein
MDDTTPVAIKRILRDAVKLCYGNPSRFVGAAALVGLPPLALSLLAMARDPDAAMSPGQGFIGLVSLALLVASFVLGIYFVGALPLMTAFALDGRPMGWTDAFSWIRDRGVFWGVFLALLLDGLAVLGGLVLLVIPGLLFGTWFMLAVPSRVLGDHRGRRALAVSRSVVQPVLTRGALSFAGLVILPVVVLTWPVYGVCIAKYGLMSSAPGRVIPPAMAAFIVGTFWGPVAGVALALLYIERSGGLRALREDLFL